MMRAERRRTMPFWNSSQTNLPRPGFCASISAAISTIQPTPSDRRRPVKISGSADGSTSLRMLRAPAEAAARVPTLMRSLSMEATPSAGVDQRRPQRAQRHRDRRDHEATSAAASLGSRRARDTTMVTMGSHASGDTGLKSWMSGLMRARSPSSTARRQCPSGTAMSVAMHEADEHRLQAREDLVDVGRLASVVAHCDALRACRLLGKGGVARRPGARRTPRRLARSAMWSAQSACACSHTAAPGPGAPRARSRRRGAIGSRRREQTMPMSGMQHADRRAVRSRCTRRMRSSGGHADPSIGHLAAVDAASSPGGEAAHRGGTDRTRWSCIACPAHAIAH